MSCREKERLRQAFQSLLWDLEAGRGKGLGAPGSGPAEPGSSSDPVSRE